MKTIRSEFQTVDKKPQIRVDIHMKAQEGEQPEVYRHEGSAVLVLVVKNDGTLSGSFRGDHAGFAPLIAQGLAMAIQARQEPQVMSALSTMLLASREEEADGNGS